MTLGAELTPDELEAQAAALEAQAQAERATVPQESTVTLFVENYQQGSFVSGIDGVPPITVEGTPVSSDQVEAVLEVAGYANVALGRK